MFEANFLIQYSNFRLTERCWSSYKSVLPGFCAKSKYMLPLKFFGPICGFWILICSRMDPILQLALAIVEPFLSCIQCVKLELLDRSNSLGPCFVQNKINILDFSSIQPLFDKLNKQLEKAQKVTESAEPPRLYIKILIQLTVSHTPFFAMDLAIHIILAFLLCLDWRS